MKEISNQMYSLLKYLAEAEGTQIHKLDGEENITSMYGIYRHANPQAKIFNEIDKIAVKLGIYIVSSEWTSNECDLINDYINQSKDLVDKFILLATEFYEQYYKRARLELFHVDCVVAMASMFANSRRISWKAVQYAINTMNRNGFIEYENLKEDSKVGQKTLKGLEACLYACRTRENIGLLFESYMLLGMSAEYSLLIKGKPERYIRFSSGWDNRLKDLQQRR